MGHADIAPRHEKVLNVARVETSVGDRITVRSIDPPIMLCDRDKWIVRKLFGVLLLRVMQINTPCTRYAAVWKLSLVHNVILSQHYVPLQLTGLAGATDISDPGQECSWVIFCSISVFHRVKGTEDGAKVPIADPFGISQGVFVKTAFPKPLAMVIHRVREVLHLQRKRPRRCRERRIGGSFIPSPHVAHAHPTFFFNGPICFGQCTKCSVPRRVDKQLATKLDLLAGPNRKRGDGLDLSAVHLRTKCVVLQKQIDVWLGSNKSLFLCIFEFLKGAWRFFGAIAELLNDLSNAWILASTNQAHRPNTNLTRSISTQDRSVLNQCYFATRTRRRDCSSHPGVTTTDHHEVVTTLYSRLGRKPQFLSSP